MKRYFLIIGLIFIFIIVAIVVATNMQSNDANDEFFVYVKDNSLILWNERNNEKIVLNSNFDSSKEMFLDIHFAYSFDKTKIIYPYNISDNSVSLRYVDINNISEENSQLIDDGVLLYEIVKNGLVYIKDMNLYHYDFKSKYINGLKDNFGFIIEDIEDTILNRTLHVKQDEKDENVKYYSDGDLIRTLLIVVQQLQEKVEKLGG